MGRVYQGCKNENGVIGIRADGNEEIGMGHLIRCISLALGLRNEGFQVLFITADDKGKGIIKSNGFNQIILHSNFKDLHSENEKLKIVLEERGVNLLIVDSYYMDEEYGKNIEKNIPVLYFEEEVREYEFIAGVINYNIYASSLDYDSMKEKGKKLYLGSKYAPLRPEFCGHEYVMKDKVQKVLILMGGSDSLNISGSLGKRFLEEKDKRYDEVEIYIVSGPFNTHFLELKEMETENLHILGPVEDMAAIMNQSDLAISAAGSTMYELAALGIPTVCCYYVENQRKIAEAFSLSAKIINAGDFSKNGEQTLNVIMNTVEKLMESKKMREENAISMHQIVDGKGAIRLAKAIKKDFFKKDVRYE